MVEIAETQTATNVQGIVVSFVLWSVVWEDDSICWILSFSRRSAVNCLDAPSGLWLIQVTKSTWNDFLHSHFTHTSSMSRPTGKALIYFVHIQSDISWWIIQWRVTISREMSSNWFASVVTILERSVSRWVSPNSIRIWRITSPTSFSPTWIKVSRGHGASVSLIFNESFRYYSTAPWRLVCLRELWNKAAEWGRRSARCQAIKEEITRLVYRIECCRWIASSAFLSCWRQEWSLARSPWSSNG